MASQLNIKVENVLVFIRNINSENNYLNMIFPCMLETATRFGFILLGMMLTDTSYRIDKTQDEIDCYIWVKHISFKVGFNLDEFSGKLYSATYALLNNKTTKWTPHRKQCLS